MNSLLTSFDLKRIFLKLMEEGLKNLTPNLNFAPHYRWHLEEDFQEVSSFDLKRTFLGPVEGLENLRLSLNLSLSLNGFMDFFVKLVIGHAVKKPLQDPF